MAGPIKIAILADANSATRSVRDFSGQVEGSVGRAAESFRSGSRSMQRSGDDAGKGFERAAEGADTADTRAMGFRDTMTGVQDSMKGASLIAKGDLFNGFLTLGMGIGDMASGLANFLIPTLGKAVAAMRAFNLTMLTNPIFLVIVAIVALVAVFVIAYKKSETFRRIVSGAFQGVLSAARSVWNWIRGNWPLLLAVITGPIGVAVLLVTKHFDQIKAKVRAIPGAIKSVFSNAGSLLVGAGKNIVQGLWGGISSLAGWIKDKVLGFVANVIPGPVRKALGIASPSRVMRRIGQFTAQGLAMGIQDGTASVRRATASMSEATIQPLGSASRSGTSGTSASTAPQVVINFNGLVADPVEAGRQVERVLNKYRTLQGRAVLA
jgi:phage-related protein